MKTLFSILFLFAFSTTFAQLTVHNGSGSSGPSGLSDAQYAAMGTNNGCRDGDRTAYNSNWSYTYHSIVDNTAINIHYREAYMESFMSCRQSVRLGETVQGATCINSQTYEVYACGTGSGGGSGGNSNSNGNQ